MSFGESAALYALTRQAYPSEVIDKVVTILGVSSEYPVLDVGCGTGIATRQLADRGLDAVGTDIDSDMIEEARLRGKARMYHVMPADGLDFAEASFGGATAFGAFHWFSDDASVQSILRVLRPGAAFVVVNKNDAGDFRNAIVKIVGRHVALRLAHPKARYQPAEILGLNGFQAIECTVLPTVEQLSAEQAIAHARSMRLWEEVPVALRAAIEAELDDYVRGRSSASGIFERKLEVTVVSGYKLGRC